jgi:hypothetical protein
MGKGGWMADEIARRQREEAEKTNRIPASKEWRELEDRLRAERHVIEDKGMAVIGQLNILKTAYAKEQLREDRADCMSPFILGAVRAVAYYFTQGDLMSTLLYNKIKLCENFINVVKLIGANKTPYEYSKQFEQFFKKEFDDLSKIVWVLADEKLLSLIVEAYRLCKESYNGKFSCYSMNRAISFFTRNKLSEHFGENALVELILEYTKDPSQIKKPAVVIEQAHEENALHTAKPG